MCCRLNHELHPLYLQSLMKRLIPVERAARAIHKSDGIAWAKEWGAIAKRDWPTWSQAGGDAQERALRRAKAALSVL